MSQSNELTGSQLMHLLEEVCAERLPLSLNCHVGSEWITCNSRFLTFNSSAQRLWVEYPSERKARGIGQLEARVGVAFKRGPRKYFFNSITNAYTAVTDTVGTRPPLALGLPSQITVLQRRLFERIEVPEDFDLRLDVYRPTPERTLDEHLLLATGHVSDVSVGGLGATVQPFKDSDLSANQPVVCVFSLDPETRPVQVQSRIRHQRLLKDGQVQLGIQFINPAPGPNGESVLKDLTQLTTKIFHMQKCK